LSATFAPVNDPAMSDEQPGERWGGLDEIAAGFRPMPLQPFPERLPGIWVPGTTAGTVLDQRSVCARQAPDLILSSDAGWLWLALSWTGQFLSVRLDPAKLAALMEEEVAYVLSLVEELEATGFFRRQARADGLYLETVLLPEWLEDADRVRAEAEREEARLKGEEMRRQKKVARTHRRKQRAR
jgi:hypothetical protein